MNEIIVNSKTREKRSAVIENGKVTKLMVQQPQEKTKIGNLYLGKVVNVKPGMNAAFVDLGEGKHGYIHRDQLPSYIQNNEPNKHLTPVTRFISEGSPIMVQVKKDETEIKGPLLTGIIELSGEKMIYLPEGKYVAVSKKGEPGQREKWRKSAESRLTGNEGLIIRTSSFTAVEEDWIKELDLLRHTYEKLLERAQGVKAPVCLYEHSPLEEEVLREMDQLKSGTIHADSAEWINHLKRSLTDTQRRNWSFQLYQQSENIFSFFGIETELDKALKRIVWLENGAYLVIDETEALVSIDVNTGKFSGTRDLEDTVLKTNEAAAAELGRQLVLRDYGGMILIDFIGMKKESHRSKVKSILSEALQKSGKHFRIEGFTSLGILQITRKRTKNSLTETLMIPCPVCQGKGKVESPETVAFRLERELWERPFQDYDAVLMEATEDVIKVFSGTDQVHIKRLENLLNVSLIFRIVHSPKPFCQIRKFGKKAQLLAEMEGK